MIVTATDPGARHIQVMFNGVEIDKVYEADTEAGMLKRYVTWHDGQGRERLAIMSDGDLAFEVRYGVVDLVDTRTGKPWGPPAESRAA